MNNNKFWGFYWGILSIAYNIMIVIDYNRGKHIYWFEAVLSIVYGFFAIFYLIQYRKELPKPEYTEKEQKLIEEYKVLHKDVENAYMKWSGGGLDLEESARLYIKEHKLDSLYKNLPKKYQDHLVSHNI